MVTMVEGEGEEEEEDEEEEEAMMETNSKKIKKHLKNNVVICLIKET
jgi:hypothetical protein